MGMIGVLEITLIVPTRRSALYTSPPGGIRWWSFLRSAWECRSGRSASALECGADVCPGSSVIHVMRSAYWIPSLCHLWRGASREACPRGAMGTISVETDVCITMSALRG